MNTDELLFKELNKFSQPLRELAFELANLYKQLPVKSAEIDNTRKALQNLNSSAIDRMDIAVNEVKDAFLTLGMKINKDSGLLDLPTFHLILRKNLLLVQKIQDLEGKVLELNRTCQD
ncbi:MAG: hypothetical protein V4501_03055 [Pseudomonadota bacterium]